ncbi:hypothetical protein [Blastopirellula marina]|uniref:Uncharacterized protein n=1 Tax=Blastopirellula marina TaxID=124 RepID=A0A2S8GT19_9BACT|nr:hypothetical protein [Blastopirellula marina]PQO47567.1 hypothetical protein C5Y93_02590 [Blastopirellula marina]
MSDLEESPRRRTGLEIAPLALGLAVGAAAFWTMGRGFAAIAVVGDPLKHDAVFRTSATAYFVLLAIAAGIIAAGFLAALEEFWARVTIGFGIGLLATGLCWNASQRIKLQPDGFVVGGLVGREYPLQPGDHVALEVEHRPGSRFGDRHSVHLHRADGTDVELCHDTHWAPIWSYAAPHLIRASRRAAAGPK